MDFEPYFKVHNFVSFHPKTITLGHLTNLNLIFHVVVSLYRLVKIWNSPQFPAQFWHGQLPPDNVSLTIMRKRAQHDASTKVSQCFICLVWKKIQLSNISYQLDGNKLKYISRVKFRDLNKPPSGENGRADIILRTRPFTKNRFHLAFLELCNKDFFK